MRTARGLCALALALALGLLLTAEATGVIGMTSGTARVPARIDTTPAYETARAMDSWRAPMGPSAWNASLAAVLVQFAAAAYCDRRQIETWSCKACAGLTSGFVVTSYVLDSHTSTNAFVGVSAAHGMILLCFEGSANLTNWLHDLEFIKVDYPYPDAPKDVRVHGGFLHAYDAVGAEVRIAIGALVAQFPTFRVVVTGHSLGGALAVFGALDLTLTAKLNVTVYTFGEPRVGNREFARFFNAAVPASIRVVNDSDIFPSLPPRIFSFFHVATEVWFHGAQHAGPNPIVCDGSGEDPDCSDSQVDLSVKDHHWYMGSEMGGGSC